VLTQPVGELASIDAAGRQIQHDALLLIKVGVNLCAVQHEKRLRGSMADALVPVDEGVVSHQREAEGRRLIRQRGIEIETGQRHLGLSEGRFERAEIPNPSRAAGLFEKSPMKLDDFRQPEVPKYVRFVSDYPQTPSGKVMKFELRAAMIAALGLDAGGRWPS